MNNQEDVYLLQEANDFFQRNYQTVDLGESGLRKPKESIYKNIISVCNGSGNDLSSVLEIGCCIGDLLNKFSKENHSNVVGIEPSSLACEYAKNNFSLNLICNTFNNSQYFGFQSQNKGLFDVIILDDVLSWMSRQLILPALASIDWLLKTNGIVYIRDFSPSFDFAYPNHHQPGEEVYNYKVSGGHKKFFMQSGMYIQLFEQIRCDSQYQKVNTTRPDSLLWSDTLLLKSINPLIPRLSLE